jgi:hypothetical protein
LAHLEEKLDFLLNGSLYVSPSLFLSLLRDRLKLTFWVFFFFRPTSQPPKQPPQPQTQQAQQHQQLESPQETTDTSEKSYSGVRNTREQSYPSSHPSVKSESENSSLRPSPSDIAGGIALYFEYCHRQPIWCFERDEISDFASMHDELACSILALTLRYSENADQAKLYANNAKSLVMLRIANGTVDLATLESLCLLSYSSFIGMLNPTAISFPARSELTAIQMETFT